MGSMLDVLVGCFVSVVLVRYVVSFVGVVLVLIVFNLVCL